MSVTFHRNPHRRRQRPGFAVRNELGEHTAVVRAIWTVTNTTSTGAAEPRNDIVLETLIPIEVFEIQTVGTG